MHVLGRIFENMVMTIPSGEDSPQRLLKLLEQAQKKRLSEKKSIAHLCGAVKWSEDPLEYQKKLRDEWE